MGITLRPDPHSAIGLEASITEGMSHAQKMADTLGNTRIKLTYSPATNWRCHDIRDRPRWDEVSPPFEHPEDAVAWLVERLSRVLSESLSIEDCAPQKRRAAE